MKRHLSFKILACLLLALGGLSCSQPESDGLEDGPEAVVKSDFTDTVTPYGPHRMVRHVRQARNGDMLIAAYNGVFRYDGKSFTNITSRIPSPSFWDVWEDRKGRLWFGTKDSGIYHFDGATFRHYATRQGLPGNSVLHLYEDRAGNMWFAAGGGLSRFDGRTFRHFTPRDGLPAGGVNAFLEDKSGRLWMGTRGEACYLEGGKFTVFKNPEGQPFHNVWALLEDQKGRIWLGGSIIREKKASTLYLEPGMWRSADRSNFTKVSDRSTSAILEDPQGNIWTTGAGNAVGAGPWILRRFDHRFLQNPDSAATEIHTQAWMLCGMALARDGSLWFGSGKGVYRYDGGVITDFRKAEERK